MFTLQAPIPNKGTHTEEWTVAWVDPFYSYRDPTLLLNVFYETRVSSDIQTRRKKKAWRNEAFTNSWISDQTLLLNSAMEHITLYNFNLVLINRNFVLLCLMLLVNWVWERAILDISRRVSFEINSLFHRSPVLFIPRVPLSFYFDLTLVWFNLLNTTHRAGFASKRFR